MHSKYKIFQKGYNNILDLLEIADYSVFKKYIQMVSSLPEEVIEKTQEFEEFSEEHKNYIADLTMCVNQIDFDYINTKDYLRTSIMIHRIFEQNIVPSITKSGKLIPIKPIEVFKMEVRNTKDKKPPLELYYEQENGNLKYMGDNDNSEKPTIDYCWTITLEQDDDIYFLRSKHTARGWDIYEKTTDVTFDEVIRTVETEDEYEEDMQIEFEADFDLLN